MATQQAWDDVLLLAGLIQSLDNEVGEAVHGKLLSLKAVFEAIIADPTRTANAVALADEHPVYNSAKIIADVGKFMALHDWLTANGYY